MTATEISHLLSQRVEDLCAYLLPNGENRGGEWCVGSLSGEPGGSLKIPLHGAKLGMFRDFAGADTDKGDMIGLWKAVRNVDVTTACQQALEWLNIPQEQRNGYRVTRQPASPKAIDAHWTELQTKLRPGTVQELQALADQRKLGGTAGLEIATSRGHLFFTDVYDNGERHPAWILTDSSRLNGQARKIDGTEWKFDGKRKTSKSKTVWSPEAGWPVGINDVGTNDIVLVEGNPDFIAAHQAIWISGKPLSPVGLFGASTVICDEALDKFKGKTVYLMAHSEESGVGLKAAQRWERQLKAAGATTVLKTFSQDGVKDLNDLLSFAVTSDQEELVTSLWPERAQAIEEENWDAPAVTAAPAADPSTPLQLIAKPLTEFKLPPRGDSSVLVGNRYISRGDIFILASTSGMGKSSLSLQIATCWALGRDIFGAFLPNGPLKSLFFQSEDSDGDIAEVWFSIMHAMKLTDEERATVRKNVIIVTDRIHRGLSFRTEAQRQIKLHSPDLVWVNPLLAFIGGDVNDSTDVGLFLREQMNSLNEPPAFAFVFIHHTAKPPKDRKDRQWNEVMYEMAGSADLTNAARAIISLQPCEKQGHFKLVLAKRGARAGAKKLVPGTANPEIKIEQPALEIGLRHSTERMEVEGQNLPVIFWEQAEIEAEKTKHPGGRPSKYSIDQFLSLFPKPGEPATTIPVLYRKVSMVSGISLSGFKDLVSRAAGDGVLTRHDTSAGYAFSVA